MLIEIAAVTSDSWLFEFELLSILSQLLLILILNKMWNEYKLNATNVNVIMCLENINIYNLQYMHRRRPLIL